MDNTEINPCIHHQLIFSKGAKKTKGGKDSLFSVCCWENWTTTSKRMKLDPYLTPFTKLYLKQIKDLNRRPETVKFLEENREKLLDIGLGNDFLDRTPKAQATKAK